MSAVSEVPPSVGHHPLGMALSRNMFKNIKGGTKSSFSKCASSEVEHNPRKSYELLSENQGTEAAEVCSPDIHINESSRAYDLMPPNLTDSENESDSDSESDVIEGVNLKHQPDPAPRVTDYAKINEIGSERINPLIEYDSTIMIRNENIDTENYIQVSSNDPRTMCFTPGGAQSDDIHPFGRTSSDDMWRGALGKKQFQVRAQAGWRYWVQVQAKQ